MCAALYLFRVKSGQRSTTECRLFVSANSLGPQKFICYTKFIVTKITLASLNENRDTGKNFSTESNMYMIRIISHEAHSTECHRNLSIVYANERGTTETNLYISRSSPNASMLCLR